MERVLNEMGMDATHICNHHMYGTGFQLGISLQIRSKTLYQDGRQWWLCDRYT